MQEISTALHTAEVVHWIALVVMAIVYTLRIRWLLSFKLAKDKSAPGNPGQSNKQRGARYSLWNVAMPWSMESTRKPKGFIFYMSFVIFHLGVVAGIAVAFVVVTIGAVVLVKVIKRRRRRAEDESAAAGTG